MVKFIIYPTIFSTNTTLLKVVILLSFEDRTATLLELLKVVFSTNTMLL